MGPRVRGEDRLFKTVNRWISTLVNSSISRGRERMDGEREKVQRRGRKERDEREKEGSEGNRDKREKGRGESTRDMEVREKRSAEETKRTREG